MNVLWSPSTKSFYHPESKLVVIPDDAYVVSHEIYNEIMDELERTGGVFGCNEDGTPCVVPAPQPTDEELSQRARYQRDGLLRTFVDPIVSNPLRWDDLSPEDKDAVKMYRRTLLDIPQSDGFPKRIEWPQIPSCCQT